MEDHASAVHLPSGQTTPILEHLRCSTPADLRGHLLRILPIDWLRTRILKIARSWWSVLLELLGIRVLYRHGRVVQVVGTHLLLNAEEAAGELIEEDVIVVSLVDLAFGAARLAVAHERCHRLEVLEARGAFHARDAVLCNDVLIHFLGFIEGLPTNLSVSR